MDFPIFHLDFLNNRMLIALIAILHVMINHPLAVGGIPLVVWLEQKGHVSGEKRWDQLAYRIMTFFFIITTTLGAMTGVGIWLSTSLVNPAAIGSLIRVFFWAWFTEWGVFVTEVVLIMFYYLTWKRSLTSSEAKQQHIRLGWFLSLASWVTMAIIVAILSFMMDPGSWHERRTLLSGFLNPIYLPQLAFRTTLAMVMGGACCLALTGLFVSKKNMAFRMLAFRQIAVWTLAWSPACILAAVYYWHKIPDTMQRHFGVAIATQAFSEWHHWLLIIMVTAFGLVFLSLLWSSMASESFKVPKWIGVPSFVLLLLFLGSFERVREFIRKPYAISGYMYANGIRVQDYPLLQKEGVLKHASYTSVQTITPNNEVVAGKELFKLTCSRCHTLNGINSIRSQLRKMYGDEPWQSTNIASYIGTMHTSRTYMPPFPGNETEKQALGKYLVSIQNGGELSGDQTEGISRIKELAPQLAQTGENK